jgi:8-oxo-dGTP pyrophosphatase MutT (NUDIX family)
MGVRAIEHVRNGSYPVQMPSIAEIRRRLAAHRPALHPVAGRRQAAVAMVLRDAGPSADVLFIERASHPSDPWSGHMAFPGGRVDPEDSDPRAAAERETLEEVGLALAAAEPLGRLDDMYGHQAAGADSLVISAFVYVAAGDLALAPNHEVREAFWFPLPSLLEPARFVERPVARAQSFRFPGILVGEPERHVVWGLTYRFLESFFQIVGRPFPDRWDARQAG